MRALSLFSGIGGIDLALAQFGVRTDVFCDWEIFCQKVLAKHFPDSKIYGDVKSLNCQLMQSDGVFLNGFDIVSGGHPCQGHSVAGKRKGKEDERYLWPEMNRIVREVQPEFVFAENVRGLFSVNNGEVFGDIIAELSEAGYRVSWACYGAGDIGAPHPRSRVFMSGIRADKSVDVDISEMRNAILGWLAYDTWPASPGFFQHSYEAPRRAKRTRGRNARLKALGNAVVPQQAFPMAVAMICRGDVSALDFSAFDEECLSVCSSSRKFDSKLQIISRCFALVTSSLHGVKKPPCAYRNESEWMKGSRPVLDFMEGVRMNKWPTWGYIAKPNECHSFGESPKVLNFMRTQFADYDIEQIDDEDLWRTPMAEMAGARVETLSDSDGNPATTGRRAYRLQKNGKHVLQSVTINQQVDMWARKEVADGDAIG